MKQFGIAILASGNGSNAEAIIRHVKGHPSIEVRLILTNNQNAFVIQRARDHDVAVQVFSRDEFASGSEIISLLEHHHITHIVLAGFLWLIPTYLLKKFPDRIINIHPALLPKYGGKGMYGMRVHDAVKVAGDLETGITIHLVNEHYDEGKMLFQIRCTIDGSCSSQDIANRVHALEHAYYPRVIEGWIMGDDVTAN